MRISDWSSDVCSSDLLGERIVTQIQYAPPDFEQDLAAHLGSAFSLTPTLLQSTYFRGHNRDARIENLYFTGAGTHPGAGIPGVVASAKATSSLILGDRTSVVSGKRVSVRVDRGGGLIIKKKKEKKNRN